MISKHSAKYSKWHSNTADSTNIK